MRNHRLFLLALAWVLCSPLAAQSVAGSGGVSGRVWESASEGLPDADVVLSNRGLGIQRTMRTTLDGLFGVTGLTPASGYRLRVTRKNFADWESGEFEVLPGQTVMFDITLRSEGASDTAASGTPRPDKSREGIETIIAADRIEGLPVRGRRLDDLTLLAPAVKLERQAGAVTFPGRAPSGSALMDGLLFGSRHSAAEAGTLAPASIESIQGFQVITAGAPAEFGHSLGSFVNVISRGGSNAVHGSARTFLSSGRLTAQDRYALGHPLFRNSSQSGVNVSGPVFRNRLYYFANLEIWDSRYQGLNRLSSPLVSDHSGAAVDSANCLAPAAQCAAAAAFLRQQMNALVPRFMHWVGGIGKLDYRHSQTNSFSISAGTAREKSPEGSHYGAVAPNGGLIGNGLSTSEISHGRAEWTAFPWRNVVNELRAGFHYDRFSTLASQPFNQTGSAAVYVGGAAVGATRAYPSLLSEERYHLADSFRFNFLNHSLTIGAELLKTRFRRDEFSFLAGAYFYPTLTAFAQDFGGGRSRSYSHFTQTLANPDRAMPVKEWNIYAQDHWQPLRNVRLSAGFRIERWLPPQPAMKNAHHYQTGEILARLRVSPRVGVSYAPDERTVVRFGFGYYHSSPSGELLDALYLGNGEYQPRLIITPDQAGAPVFPASVSRTSIPSGTRNLLWATKEARNPYSRQFSLAVERSLGFQTSLTAGYLGSTGVSLWVARDMNLAGSVKSATYAIHNAAGQKVGEYTTDVWTARNEPIYAHLYTIESGGRSSYHALLAQIRKPFSGGLSFGAAYTWSHAIDNTGGTLLPGGIPLSSHNGDPSKDWGSSATDQRHRLVIDWVWQPRLGAGSSRLFRVLLNGWAVSSIATLASSQPATAVVLVNGQQFSDFSMAFPTTLNGGGGWARVPFLPVNSLYAEPGYTVNARLSRTQTFAERFKGTVLFEAFNLTNSQYDTGVNTIAYVASGGVLRPVPRLGAGNASHGYPNGTNARSCQVSFRLQF